MLAEKEALLVEEGNGKDDSVPSRDLAQQSLLTDEGECKQRDAAHGRHHADECDCGRDKGQLWKC